MSTADLPSPKYLIATFSSLGQTKPMTDQRILQWPQISLFLATLSIVMAMCVFTTNLVHAQEAEEEAAPATNSEFGTAPSFAKQREYTIPKTKLQYNLDPGKTNGYEFRYQSDLQGKFYGFAGTIVQKITSLKPSTLNPNQKEEKVEGSGTAFVVRPDGFLVTCAHVVEGSKSVTVHLEDKQYDAKVVDMDFGNDLALLRIDADNLTPLPIMDSSKIELAEEIRVVGFPLSTVLGESLKISRGTVSGIGPTDGSQSFQLDAVVNPGNSGGPVVTEKGHVAGVAKAALEGEGIVSVGLAVTSNDVRRMLERNQLKYRVPPESDDYLRGPDLAKKVAPAVALLKVTSGDGGVGIAQQRVISYDASYLPNVDRDKPVVPALGGYAINESGKTLANAFGEVDYCDGKLGLPCLMGALGTMGLETFPREDVDQWQSQKLLFVPRQRLAGLMVDFLALPTLGTRLNPNSDFDSNSGRPRLTLGQLFSQPVLEVSDYKIVSEKGHIIEIEKKHELTSIHKEDELPAFKMSGKATIQFNTRLGRMDSIHYLGNAEVTANQITLRIPVAFTCFSTEISRKDALAAAPELPQQQAPPNQVANNPGPQMNRPPRTSTRPPSFSPPKPATPPQPSKPIPRSQGLSKLKLD